MKFQSLGVISLETPQRKWASSRLEGTTSWIFSNCGRCSRLTMGTSGTRSGGLRKGQSPCELLGGLSGFLSRRCWGLRPCVESGPEPEDSSPVLTWILAYFWSLPSLPPFPEPPDVSVYSRETCFPCTASTFMSTINSHHGGTWDSPVGKTRGKASRESHRSLDPRNGKRDTAATAREESARACPH